MLDETPAFTRSCLCVFVVEYNATGQLARLIVAHGGAEAHIESVLVYDGVPLRAEDLVEKVIERMDSRRHKAA
jgi:pyruvate/2-oxoacid:ferredoxin oxidoreductase alpha subunit